MDKFVYKILKEAFEDEEFEDDDEFADEFEKEPILNKKEIKPEEPKPEVVRKMKPGFNVLVQMSKDVNASNKTLILKRLDNNYSYTYNVFNGEIKSELANKELYQHFNQTMTKVLNQYKMKDGFKVILKNVIPGRQAKFIMPQYGTEIVVIGKNPQDPSKFIPIQTYKM